MNFLEKIKDQSGPSREDQRSTWTRQVGQTEHGGSKIGMRGQEDQNGRPGKREMKDHSGQSHSSQRTKWAGPGKSKIRDQRSKWAEPASSPDAGGDLLGREREAGHVVRAHRQRG